MSALLDMSLLQVLDIWVELEKAYHGTNSYNGHTAEIYAYRLLRKNPLANEHAGEIGRENFKADARRAGAALRAIMELFEEKHECAEIFVEEEIGIRNFREIGFNHRVHVYVRKPHPCWCRDCFSGLRSRNL